VTGAPLVDSIARFSGDRRVQRVTALALFALALYALRHLAILLVSFLVFRGLLGFASDRLATWTKVGRKVWIGALVLALLGAAGGAVWGELHRLVPGLSDVTERARGQLQERMQAVRDTDLYRMLEAQQIDPEKYAEKVQGFAENLVHGAAATGRMALHVLLGLILAVLALLEREELEEGLRSISRESFVGHFVAYGSFLAEAVVLTVKVQVIVAAVNAVVTLPVLLVLRLSHVPALMLMVFAFGLVPVVGNFLSGAVLIALAYLKKGLFGVAVFSVSTFLLHKVESYYLNPRLTAKHVKLPSVALIASLIIWEHLAGLAGVFLSFPALYVAMKVRDLFRENPSEADVVAAAGSEPEPAADLEATSKSALAAKSDG
jgi:predicted PurR-regulated permease PerM